MVRREPKERCVDMASRSTLEGLPRLCSRSLMEGGSRRAIAGVRHAQALFEPVIHVHLAVHPGGGGEIVASILWAANATIELAQSEMAMRDERAHAPQLREG